MTELLHAELTYELRGLAFDVHNELRGGHEESVYETALAYAMEAAGIAFQRQPVFRLLYQDQQVGEYRPDFMVGDGRVLLELKAVPAIEPLHKAQTISYLAVTHADLGLIMNFGGVAAQIRRVPNFVGQQPLEEYSFAVPDAEDLLYPELTKDVLDALAHVHRTLGTGFLHQVYRRAVRIELAQRHINHIYIKELPLLFKGTLIAQKPTRLLHVDNKILVAVVALKEVTDVEKERLRWAMRGSNARLGLIANFHGTRLKPHFVRQS